MAWLMRRQSSSLRRPLRTLVESTRASEHSRRWDSSTRLISSEKNSTGRGSLEGGVAGHAHGERGLAHAGTSADHDQGVGLETGSQLVEVGEAGGRAGDGVAALVERLEAVERLVEQVVQARHGVGLAVLGDLEHEGLGAVDGLGHIVGHVVAHLGDLAGDADEAAEQRVLLDDLGVARRARGGRGGRLEVDERGRTTDGVEQVVAATARRPP